MTQDAVGAGMVRNVVTRGMEPCLGDRDGCGWALVRPAMCLADARCLEEMS
jgi:hypothetical protein